jgi:NAD(P)-dependent dehydrogenase (short-subunit alcohol dehydrogenase family)
MKEKIAVVTGVTSGIGAALVTRLLARGATVVGIARDAAKLQPLGDSFVPFIADLAEADRSRMFAEIAERFPRVDVLVNNAAECVYASPIELSPDKMRRLVEINLLAPIELVRVLAPRMQRGAHVVNVSSVTARHLPNPRFAAYGLTKAAIDATTEAIRLELDPKGVRVTSIVPGLVDTPIYDKVEGFARTRDKIRESLPQWLVADDVADAIVWALDRPAHVVAAEIVLLPLGQAR